MFESSTTVPDGGEWHVSSQYTPSAVVTPVRGETKQTQPLRQPVCVVQSSAPQAPSAADGR